MKRIIQGLLLTGTLVVGGAAVAQGNAQGSGQGATQGSGAAGTTGSATQGQMSPDTTAKAGKSAAKGGMLEHMGFKVPADEKAMLERLHHVNQHEIQVGKLAQQNGQSQDVKSYGDMLVRDHTTSDQQIMAYAQQKGLKLGTPKPMDDVERKSMAAQKANLEKLQALKGAPFDSCFLSNMVGEHDEVIGKLMASRQGTVDPSLTPIVQQLTQFVTQHRQQAHSLLSRVGPGATTTGVGGSGDMNQGVHHDMNKGTGGSGDMNKDKMGPGDKNTMDPGNQKKF
ncbi:DUF4142 domain-containing protein [Hyalangium gracile]|uniref:DUF4142 domain-containing protein n=1 Tax=Hyalangium gracile TaxID=394092 RepID=UPI001CCAB4D7|nr:DUF4142 domain-containing protein [Hyalangium gracile]